MIIWFTGQPKSGKTTLARSLSKELGCPWIDGDRVREMVGNHDYSIEGRRENISLIQQIALVSDRHNKYCVVSAVAPFRDQRDAFKQRHNVLEVYLPTPPNHKTAHHVPYYEPPVQYFLEVNTFLFTPDVCLAKIMDSLTPIHA